MFDFLVLDFLYIFFENFFFLFLRSLNFIDIWNLIIVLQCLVLFWNLFLFLFLMFIFLDLFNFLWLLNWVLIIIFMLFNILRLFLCFVENLLISDNLMILFKLFNWNFILSLVVSKVKFFAKFFIKNVTLLMMRVAHFMGIGFICPCSSMFERIHNHCFCYRFKFLLLVVNHLIRLFVYVVISTWVIETTQRHIVTIWVFYLWVKSGDFLDFLFLLLFFLFNPPVNSPFPILLSL